MKFLRYFSQRLGYREGESANGSFSYESRQDFEFGDDWKNFIQFFDVFRPFPAAIWLQ
jgi:hypothetical protein